MATKKKTTKKKRTGKSLSGWAAVEATRVNRRHRVRRKPKAPNPSAAAEAAFAAADRLFEGRPELEAGYAAWIGLKHLAEEFAPNLPPAELDHALEVGHFLTRLLVGHAGYGDIERLHRMRAVMHNSEESRRVYAVELVRGALKEGGWPAPSGLREALGQLIDPAFLKLDKEATEALLANPGRKGPVAVAAELSLRCKAFGDLGDHKLISKRFEAAMSAMRRLRVAG